VRFSPVLGPDTEVADEAPFAVCWKNLTTSTVEDDLIVFPGDATFTRVAEAPAPGRVYVLKFASSSA
jgi:26S proteasome regulatory subunit N13